MKPSAYFRNTLRRRPPLRLGWSLALSERKKIYAQYKSWKEPRVQAHPDILNTGKKPDTLSSPPPRSCVTHPPFENAD